MRYPWGSFLPTAENYVLNIPPQHLRSDERVTIASQEDQTLNEGAVLYYRKWYDIHVQRPPKSFSLSLNVIVDDPTIPQYSFDVRRGAAIKQIGGAGYALSGLLEIAATLGVPDLEYFTERYADVVRSGLTVAES